MSTEPTAQDIAREALATLAKRSREKTCGDGCTCILDSAWQALERIAALPRPSVPEAAPDPATPSPWRRK